MEITVPVTQEEMIPRIKDVWHECENEMLKLRKKLGSRYNIKNSFEQVERRFCSASKEPERWLEEYMLIEEKRSNLPASVRSVVQYVVGKAFGVLLADKKKEQEKQQA